MLVAQEPDLSSTITRLVGRSRIALKKGGVAQVEVPDVKTPHGRLLALLSPTLFADHHPQPPTPPGGLFDRGQSARHASPVHASTCRAACPDGSPGAQVPGFALLARSVHGRACPRCGRAFRL